MKQLLRLGTVCLARKTFDYNAAKQLYLNIVQEMKTMEQVELVSISSLIIEPEEARTAARELAGKGIDALVVVSGTFHLGHLVLELRTQLHVPLLLWGLPELPYDGGKIRLNSVCGVNLDASNLYKSGTRDYHVCVGARIDEDWVDAIRIQTAIQRTHLGIIGFRARGFFNLGVYDLAVYQEMGVFIDHYELQEVWNFPVSAGKIAEKRAQVTSIFEVSELSEEQLEKVAQITAKFERFLDAHDIHALSIRCWPEFATHYGISPCVAMSILQSEGRIMSCEGDIEGALSMVAHKAIGAQTPYLCDFSQIDFDNDTALLWHCGVAPCNLWDGKCVRSLSTYFAEGKGVTADFVLKDGEISLLRLDSAGTHYRMFLAHGQVIPMEKDLRGTYMRVRFDEPVKKVFHRIVDNGIAHHVSAVYGEFREPLRIFAKIRGWDVVE